MKDPDAAVRRRASMLALALTGDAAQRLGEQAIVDTDLEVRSLAALVLGASNAERARPLLLEAMCDEQLKVRRAAAQSLSRLLGQDVTGLVNLEGAQRRRVVRQLGAQPSAPVLAKAGLPPAMLPPAKPSVAALMGVQAQRASVEAPPPAVATKGSHFDPSTSSGQAKLSVNGLQHSANGLQPNVNGLQSRVSGAAAPVPVRAATATVDVDVDTVAAVLSELRTSIRGKNLAELAQGVSRTPDDTMNACRYLEAKGQVLRRGMKFFVA